MYKVIERRYEASIYNHGGVYELDTTCIDDSLVSKFDIYQDAIEELKNYQNEYELITNTKYDVVEYLISYEDKDGDIQEFNLDDFDVIDFFLEEQEKRIK